MAPDASALTETAPHDSPMLLSASRKRGIIWLHPTVQFLELGKNTLTFGRAPDSGAVLESSQISRKHATLVNRDGHMSLRDESSRNGTFVNGERISNAQLKPNDVIRLGDFVGVVLECPEFDERAPFIEPVEGLFLGPQTQHLWPRLQQLASSGQPVLIEGGTGTGKEVFARALHAASGRTGVLTAINCAAIPDTLVEAQLFGYAKGAFTGANQATAGLIESAHKGTFFLDEIADLPLAQQAKLLRTIEERAVHRVGENAPRAVDVRYVAACQTSLWKLSQDGKFRADLLGRLAGGRIRLEPLANRREEIPQLFVRYLALAGGEPQSVSANAIEALCLARWPLNVRQVVQAARLTAATHRNTTLTAAEVKVVLDDVLADPEFEQAREEDTDNPPSLEAGDRRQRWLERHKDELQRLTEALPECNNNLSEACRRTGVPRWRAIRLLEANAEKS